MFSDGIAPLGTEAAVVSKAPAPKPKVVLQGVERRYGDIVALAALDLTVGEGEFLTLLGPSGCGKTTTLRIIAGFIDPSAGHVLIDGRDVVHLPPNRREVGMVFQNYALFPHLTVAENIAFGMKQRGASKAARAKRVGELLDLVQLTGKGERYPSELSGGQRQRVAIARAVAHPPAILLMDEPLGALDLKLRETMQQELRALQRQLRITTLYVTHDQTEAMVMSDRIVIMRDGRVEQIGTPAEIYNTPQTRFVASFVGRINFVPIRLKNGVAVCQSTGTQIRVGEPLPAGDGEATLALRPEWMRVLQPAETMAGSNILTAYVSDAVFLGSHVSLKAELGHGTTITVDCTPESWLPRQGEMVRIGWPPDKGILLPAER